MSTERKPLLSDEEGWALCPWITGLDSWEEPMNAVRDFYEAKITSGELSKCATLVVHDGPYEDVYTKSEVRDLIRGMIELLEADPEQVLAAIEAVNAKHGLGLSDPA